MKAAPAEQLATISDDAAKKADFSEEDIARAQKIKDKLKADQRQLDLSKKSGSKQTARQGHSACLLFRVSNSC